MGKQKEDRPYFDENKNYLDDDPKPLFGKKKVIEEKVVIRRIQKQFLSYKEAEIIYSLQHKKLLELADDCGALYRDGNIVRINREIFDKTGFWEDETRLPEYYNGTYQYLKSIGFEEI